MDLEKLRFFRKLVLISLFSDDDFLEKFVVKGGSAIDLVYKLDSRASIDIDVSIENDFTKEELNNLQSKLQAVIGQTFEENGYTIFDLKVVEKPKEISADIACFWGGYQVEFKIQPLDKKGLIEKDIERARKTAEIVGFNETKRFTVDISKYEYCRSKEMAEIDGYTIYVYPPKMLVFEKLRAICQQMAEYPINGGRTKKPRPSDFYDIYILTKHFKIELTDEDLAIITAIFQQKQVDLDLLLLILQYKDFFIQGLDSLKSTLTADKIETFDFDTYFNFVIGLSDSIITLNEAAAQ